MLIKDLKQQQSSDETSAKEETVIQMVRNVFMLVKLCKLVYSLWDSRNIRDEDCTKYIVLSP